MLRYDPDAIAKILAGEAERLHRVRSANQAKAVAAAKRNRLARQREVWRKRRGCRQGRLLELPGWQVLAARMEPGVWYGRPDLRRLIPEFAEGSVRAWVHQKLWPGGAIERAPNPAFDRERAPGRQSEPQWLYRLTERGEALAAAWRRELAECCAMC